MFLQDLRRSDRNPVGIPTDFTFPAKRSKPRRRGRPMTLQASKLLMLFGRCPSSLRRIIHTLSRIDSIPIVDWRFHIGDLGSRRIRKSRRRLLATDSSDPIKQTTSDIVWLRTWITVL